MTTDGATQVRDQAASATELGKRYHLFLLDDSDHTYQYVVEMLGRIFGYGKEKAFAIAAVVDGHGRAVVETAARDQVLRHQRRIHAYGADPRLQQSQGSMSAILEEAP